jgi:hypothetical protein
MIRSCRAEPGRPAPARHLARRFATVLLLDPVTAGSCRPIPPNKPACHAARSAGPVVYSETCMEGGRVISPRGCMRKVAAIPPQLTAAVVGFREFSLSWGFAGGWALDLWAGRVTRDHSDVDVAVFRGDQGALRAALVGWTFEVVVDGERRPWRAGEWLSPPMHEVHALPATGADPMLEILFNEREGADWVFRRDPAVRRTLSRALLITSAGLNVLAPEIVLLFKAKARRPADELDFAAVLPELSEESRAWLASALERCHAGHPWLFALNRRAAEQALAPGDPRSGAQSGSG